jgi:hypothetical protein
MKGDILKSMFRGAQAALCGVATLGCVAVAWKCMQWGQGASAGYNGMAAAFILLGVGVSGLGVYRSTRSVASKKAAFV